MKKIVLRLLNKFKLLKYLNLTYHADINKHKISIPIHRGMGYNNLYMSELWMIDVLTLCQLTEKEVFIDVGVNIGQTLIKFKTVYPHMEYIGFEPNSHCVYYVEMLRDQNNWENIHLIPSGISDNVGLGILEHYADDTTDSSASIIANYREGSKVYQRDVVTLLDVASVEHIWENKKVSAIKIDVEGAELGAIKSFEEILKKDRPYVLVEILPVYDGSNINRLESQIAIEKILNDLEYKIYRIIKNTDGRLDSIVSIDTIGIHDNLEWCDYIFSPKALI